MSAPPKPPHSREVGRDELLLGLGLLLLTGGLWARVGPVALVAPGLVLLWIALPPRWAFVVRQPETPGKGRT